MKKVTLGRRQVDGARIFNLLRKRIAEELQRDDLEFRPAQSQLELSIGTFAPSELLKQFSLSDYPFIEARYVSLRDGHVYIVYGATDDGSELVAYRLPFWRSCLTSRGGIGVAITESAWMDSMMIMFSLNHAGMAVNGQRQLTGLEMGLATRRSFPMKKLRAYAGYLRRRFVRRAPDFRLD